MNGKAVRAAFVNINTKASVSMQYILKTLHIQDNPSISVFYEAFLNPIIIQRSFSYFEVSILQSLLCNFTIS